MLTQKNNILEFHHSEYRMWIEHLVALVKTVSELLWWWIRSDFRSLV